MESSNAVSWILSHRWAILPSMLRTIVDVASRGVSSDSNISEVIARQAAAEAPGAIAAKDAKPLPNSRRVEIRDGVAIMQIVGPIFPRANLFTAISGGTSVQLLAKDLTAVMADDSVKALLINADSPGGEVTGISELADMLYNARNVKPIVFYGYGMICSAAYWLASATSKIVIDATAEVGSIGVVAAYTDQRERDKKSGIQTIEIVSSVSPNKRPDPQTDAGKAQIQKVVDEMAGIFVARVARNRGVSSEKVLKDYGRGCVLIGRGAVTAGLADEVGSFESVLADLACGKRTIFAPWPAARAVTASELKAENPAVYDSIRAEARAEGVAEGKKAGNTEGYSRGFDLGKNYAVENIKSIATLMDTFPDQKETILQAMSKPGATKENVTALVVGEHAESLRPSELDAIIAAAVARVNAGRR
jgi:ClpP class serine protease